jgi:hypothetical protein
VDKQLGDRIEIPLVTALYEQVITKGGTLSVYSIGALLGAARLAVMSKLMHGTLPFSAPANTPFPAWPFDARGKPIPRQAPRSQPTVTVTVQLSWALGAVSSFLTPFAGWVANQRRLIGAAEKPDRRKPTGPRPLSKSCTLSAVTQDIPCDHRRMQVGRVLARGAR